LDKDTGEVAGDGSGYTATAPKVAESPPRSPSTRAASQSPVTEPLPAPPLELPQQPEEADLPALDELTPVEVPEPASDSSPDFQHVRGRRGLDPESRANEGYKLLEALRDKVGGMLLLTATPMQLHEFELYSMVELVEPGLFNGYGDFSASRSEIAAINRAVTGLRAERPAPTAIDEAAQLLERFSAQPGLAAMLRGDRGDRLVVADWLSRCHRLATALVRNRKAEIGGFTSRVAHTVLIQPNEDEVALQKDLVAYIRDRYASAEPRKRRWLARWSRAAPAFRTSCRAMVTRTHPTIPT
jgi:hypothetical protein